MCFLSLFFFNNPSVQPPTPPPPNPPKPYKEGRRCFVRANVSAIISPPVSPVTAGGGRRCSRTLCIVSLLIYCVMSDRCPEGCFSLSIKKIQDFFFKFLIHVCLISRVSMSAGRSRCQCLPYAEMVVIERKCRCGIDAVACVVHQGALPSISLSVL